MMKTLHFVIAAALVLAVVCEGRADFALNGVEHMDVTSSHNVGELFDSSTASVTTGGSVGALTANDSSSVSIVEGGSVGTLICNGSSNAIVSGVSVVFLQVHDSSSTVVSGGDILFAQAYGNSNLDLTGGQVLLDLAAFDFSNITFHGTDFEASNGLSLDGQNVLGSGRLTGKWFDGTPLSMYIGTRDPGVTIQAVPEPATLSLLALGALAALRRRRSRASRA